MSEYFQGVTFANQNVSPVDDAVLRRRLLSDGVLTGCDLTYAGYTLTMASGYLIACGRQIRRPTAENWAISDATSGYAANSSGSYGGTCRISNIELLE